MTDYTLTATTAGQLSQIGAVPATPPSPLASLAAISRKQTQDIRDLTNQLNELANRLFGQEPAPLNPTTPQGVPITTLEPPLMMAAEQTQFGLGEAIEALCRAVSRVDRL